MTSDKAIAQWIIEALQQIGVQSLVFSPGSRNAPLIIAGTAHTNFSYHTVLDERSAAFQAIGEALITQKPVALCCTSGSAVANYYPGVLEAFYSKIPLLIITADRPANRIGKGEGQSCVQQDFFHPHVGASFELSEVSSKSDLLQVMNTAAKILKEKSEPIHINVSFEEPLYGQCTQHEPLSLQIPQIKKHIPLKLDFFEPSMNIAIVCGQLNPHESEYLKKQKVLHQSKSTWFVDPLSGLLDEPNTVHIERIKSYDFEGLISLGGQWMSKFPKFHVRQLALKKHLHIDLYQAWNVSDAQEFKWVKSTLSDTVEMLLKINALKVSSHPKMDQDLEWSDALAFKTILSGLESTCVLHLANSSIPRYLSFFSHKGMVFSNRGISGIDGSLSTAVGAARADSKRKHVLIIGDQSALYDSNALKELAELQNLQVFILNNRSGAIFDWLPGTEQNSDQAQKVYSNYHEVQIAMLAKAYNCSVSTVQDVEGLQAVEQVHLVEVLTFDAPNADQFEKLNNYRVED
jgi:2-succinyl-5-enolpyruvyl-6-hydroxy-3-cyclohexene-1-carboxylate synthase